MSLSILYEMRLFINKNKPEINCYKMPKTSHFFINNRKRKESKAKGYPQVCG